MKTVKNIDINALVSLLSTLKDSTLFLGISLLNFGKGWWLGLPAEIKVKITKHAKTGTNYAILKKQVKLQQEKKPVLNLESIQRVGFEQTFMKFIELFVLQEKFLYWKKTTVENISMAVNDSSDVRCFCLHLITICTDISKVILHCLSVIIEDLDL